MKKIFRSIIVLASLLFSSCGNANFNKAIPEMQTFMSYFGSFDKLQRGFAKYGAEGLDTKDMDIHDLKEPEITAIKEEGEKHCYTISATDPLEKKLVYTLCWEKGKIISVEEGK